MKNAPSNSIPDPLVVFDGHCILCNRALQFYFNKLAKSKKPYGQNPTRKPFHYTAAQSPWAQRNLPIHVLHKAHHTIQTHRNNHWHSGPPALWPLIARMAYPWRLLLILRLLPRPVSHAIYRFIAQRRYRWFGTQKSCNQFEPPTGHRLLHQ